MKPANFKLSKLSAYSDGMAILPLGFNSLQSFASKGISKFVDDFFNIIRVNVESSYGAEK